MNIPTFRYIFPYIFYFQAITVKIRQRNRHILGDTLLMCRVARLHNVCEEYRWLFWTAECAKNAKRMLDSASFAISAVAITKYYWCALADARIAPQCKSLGLAEAFRVKFLGRTNLAQSQRTSGNINGIIISFYLTTKVVVSDLPSTLTLMK